MKFCISCDVPETSGNHFVMLVHQMATVKYEPEAYNEQSR